MATDFISSGFVNSVGLISRVLLAYSMYFFQVGAALL